MLEEAIALVRIFQRCAGQPAPERPVMADPDRVKTRIRWITEELEEYLEAETVYEQADALIDTLYYLLGAFVDSGIRADRLFEIVHQSNMRKISPDVSIVRAEDSKIEKPAEWIHPDLEVKEEIDRQMR